MPSRPIVRVTLLAAASVLLGAAVSAAPSNVRVNDPAGDTTLDDGTHVTQAHPQLVRFPTGSGTALLDVFEDVTETYRGQDSAVGYATSADGGASWTDRGAIPGGNQVFLDAAPTAAYDQTHGVVVVASEACNTSTNACSPAVVRSTDGGQTWSAPIQVFTGIAAGHLGDRPWIAADNNVDSPSLGNVYVAWVDSADGTADVVVSVSQDGGVTWAPPVRVNDPQNTLTAGPVTVVGELGTVYVAFDNLHSSTYDVLVDRSVDGGASWGTDRSPASGLPLSGNPFDCGEVTRVYRGNIGAADFPGLAVETDDELYVAFTEHGAGTDASDVFFADSVDGGRLWSNPVPVAQRAGDQFYPSVSVNPEGSIGVSYYDDFLHPTQPMYDVFTSFSLNGGRRWSPSQRTTTTSFGIPDLHPNQDTGAPDCFFGDRLDLQPNGGGFLATWTGGMDPDIFFAPVRTYTTLTLSIKPGVGRITATGTLDPAVVGGKVTATLFRKSGNRFLKVASRTVRIDADGNYAAGLRHPVANTCRMKARYGGDAQHLPSTKTKAFAC